MLHCLLVTIFFTQFKVQNSLKIKIGNIYDPDEGKVTSLASLKMAERDLRANRVIGSDIEFE